MMLFTYIIYYFIKICTHLFTDNNNNDDIVISNQY